MQTQGYDLSKIPDDYAVSKDGLLVPISCVQVMCELKVTHPDGSEDVTVKPARSFLRNYAKLFLAQLDVFHSDAFPGPGTPAYCPTPGNNGFYGVVTTNKSLETINETGTGGSSPFVGIVDDPTYCNGQDTFAQYRPKILFGASGPVAPFFVTGSLTGNSPAPLTRDYYLRGCPGLGTTTMDASSQLNSADYTEDYVGGYLTTAERPYGTGFYAELDAAISTNDLRAQICDTLAPIIGSTTSSQIICAACAMAPEPTGTGAVTIADSYPRKINDIALQLAFKTGGPPLGGPSGSRRRMIVLRDVFPDAQGKTINAGDLFSAKYTIIYNV
jgi:hypothetical protein